MKVELTIAKPTFEGYRIKPENEEHADRIFEILKNTLTKENNYE